MTIGAQCNEVVQVVGYFVVVILSMYIAEFPEWDDVMNRQSLAVLPGGLAASLAAHISLATSLSLASPVGAIVWLPSTPPVRGSFASVPLYGTFMGTDMDTSAPNPAGPAIELFATNLTGKSITGSIAGSRAVGAVQPLAVLELCATCLTNACSLAVGVVASDRTKLLALLELIVRQLSATLFAKGCWIFNVAGMSRARIVLGPPFSMAGERTELRTYPTQDLLRRYRLAARLARSLFALVAVEMAGRSGLEWFAAGAAGLGRVVALVNGGNSSFGSALRVCVRHDKTLPIQG